MSQKMVCATCGSFANTKSKTSGSLLVEIVLWLCFIIPGLIYSAWRLSSRKGVCSVCGGSNMVPIDSPVGMKILKEHNVPADQIEKAKIENSKPDIVRATLRWVLIGFGAIVFLGILGMIFD